MGCSAREFAEDFRTLDDYILERFALAASVPDLLASLASYGKLPKASDSFLYLLLLLLAHLAKDTQR